MMFADAVRRIEVATSFADLVDSGDGETTYRSYAKVVHPDAVTGAESATATWAFAKLSGLYGERETRIAVGDIADLFAAGDEAHLVKVPRDPADNDLMEAEAAALRTLRGAGDPKYRAYAPKLVETYLHEDHEWKRRQVNVLERLDGFVPVSRIGRRDPPDVAWMWRRALVGLGWAHRAGVVHGAVLEEHLMIHPEQHGVAFVDWCYSGPKVKVVVKSRRDAYPPEVLKEKTATPATDIFMATGLMTRLIGPDMPKPLRRFADGCCYDAPRMRPQDAWRLLAELDEILHNLYGPRKFRPFQI